MCIRTLFPLLLAACVLQDAVVMVSSRIVRSDSSALARSEEDDDSHLQGQEDLRDEKVAVTVSSDGQVTLPSIRNENRVIRNADHKGTDRVAITVPADAQMEDIELENRQSNPFLSLAHLHEHGQSGLHHTHWRGNHSVTQSLKSAGALLEFPHAPHSLKDVINLPYEALFQHRQPVPPAAPGAVAVPPLPPVVPPPAPLAATAAPVLPPAAVSPAPVPPAGVPGVPAMTAAPPMPVAPTYAPVPGAVPPGSIPPTVANVAPLPGAPPAVPLPAGVVGTTLPVAGAIPPVPAAAQAMPNPQIKAGAAPGATTPAQGETSDDSYTAIWILAVVFVLGGVAVAAGVFFRKKGTNVSGQLLKAAQNDADFDKHAAEEKKIFRPAGYRKQVANGSDEDGSEAEGGDKKAAKDDAEEAGVKSQPPPSRYSRASGAGRGSRSAGLRSQAVKLQAENSASHSEKEIDSTGGSAPATGSTAPRSYKDRRSNPAKQG